MLLAGTSLVNNLAVHSWLILACISDYQDKQDHENHKLTLGADISIYSTTADLIFSHSI